MWGPLQKKPGTKTCKIRRDFGQLQPSIANISETDGDIQKWKTNMSTAIPPAFGEKKSGELWWTIATKLRM